MSWNQDNFMLCDGYDRSISLSKISVNMNDNIFFKISSLLNSLIVRSCPAFIM